MWEDDILEDLHRIREEHAQAFNYDIRAICEDWRRRQAQSGRKFVTPNSENQTAKTVQQAEQK